MNWLLPVIVSVVLYAVAVLLQRVILAGKKVDPTTYSLIFQLLVAVTLTPIVYINGFSFTNFSDHLWLMALASVAFGIGTVMYAKTLERVEASTFAVLFSTANIWVMLYGVVFLGEALHLPQVIGAVMVFASILLLVDNVRGFRLERGVALGLMTGAIYGVAMTSTSLLTRSVDVYTWTWLSFITGAIVSLFFSPRSIRHVKHMATDGGLIMKLLVLSMIYGVGTLAIMVAYRDGPLSLISPIRQSGVLVTTLLALAFLKSERRGITKKILAAIVCLIGAILVAIDF